MTEPIQKVVLIAEDEIDLRSALVEAFTNADFRVIAASDGAAAWDSFQAERPDIVLLDIHMPRMSGVEVLQEIRASENGQNVPVTVLTATDTMDAISDVTTVGGINTDFFGKTDMSLEQIINHVRTRLGE